MPSWVRQTFTASDDSLASVARRTLPRFQTRRWLKKQEALLAYINGGFVDPTLVELG